jgi:hypothetical protein
MLYDAGVDEADRFVQTAEVNDLINTAYKELYGQLIRHGMQRSETVYTVTATGAATYALPADFWALLGVHLVDTAGRRFPLERHDHRHRPDRSFNSDAISYRVVNTTLELSPVPLTGSYEVLYVPLPGELTDDADLVDGVLGWEEYVVLWVAARLLKKEGSLAEANSCIQDAQALMQRIQDEAQAAELNNGNRIANTRHGISGRGLPGDYAFSIRPRWGF